jgi:hypothetical protein
LGPVFMFCAPILIFGVTEGVRSRFHVLRSRTRFRRYRGRQVLFSYFALPGSFSTLRRAWTPIFMFCGPGLIFSGNEGVGSHFYVLRPSTHFRRYRGRRLPFSCFAVSASFPEEPRASGLVFMFCALGLISRGTEGIGSRFHVLCARTHFRRYRGCRVPFSCCATLFRVLCTAAWFWAMGCGRRTQRSLLNVHLFNAGWSRRLRLIGMHI